MTGVFRRSLSSSSSPVLVVVVVVVLIARPHLVSILAAVRGRVACYRASPRSSRSVLAPSACTGRVLQIHPKHATLARSRARQRDPDWQRRYRATRPKIERKIAQLMRREHGGRRARLRGRVRIGHDFAMLAAAANLSRLAVLGASVRAVADT